MIERPEPTLVKFEYDYNDENGEKCTLVHEFYVPFQRNKIEEVVVAAMSKMPPMLRLRDENMRLPFLIEDFIEQEHLHYMDNFAEKLISLARNNEMDNEEILRELELLYKEETLQFADRVGPTDEEIFAQSFHRLVHSSSLDDMLTRERAYAKVIADLTQQMDEEIDKLSSNQQEEMEKNINQLDITTTSDDINNLLAQQYTTQNYMRKRNESELEAKMGHQKNEYRNWITSQVGKVFQASPVTTPLGNRSSMFISQQPSMEESFTIHLGSQLKHMHNIRILSANITDLCSPLHAEESLNGLNMALGLYSSALCGVVVLTPSIQAQANKAIMKNANMSTEFHFDQIDVQMEKIEQEIRKLNMNDCTTPSSGDSVGSATSNSNNYTFNSNNGGGANGNGNASGNGNGNAAVGLKTINAFATTAAAAAAATTASTATATTTSGNGSGNTSPTKSSAAKLKTGDFFITKHSNLSQCHVIFHLISDEPINSPSEINSRHPVILGLRNILKTASRHDVTMLTIPALLRHEMSEDMTVQWCMRRAELVFKCAKGFMIESATWGGAELSTLQLLLPHDISEELFNTLASMVPNVFRVANPKIL